MPRRNRTKRTRTFRPTEDAAPVYSYEALARALVRGGVCSPAVLEKPLFAKDDQ